MGQNLGHMKFGLLMNKIILTAVLIILASSPALATDRVIPQSDLVYSGSFKAPSGVRNGSDWAYRYFSALGFRPGDGNNPTGYLIGGGHNTFPILAEEIAIPTPVINHSFNINNIPAATVTIPFADITGGRQITGGDGGTKLSDILYLSAQTGQTSAQYYWSMAYYYDTSGQSALPRLGWSDLDYSNPAGAWTLNTETRRWDKYLLEINNTWAAAHVDGKKLGVGRIRENGSFGASLYATAPWEDGLPPSANQQIGFKELIDYPDDQHIAEYYSYGGQGGIGSDAAWVTIGSKQAFVVLIDVALSSDDGDKFYKSSFTKTTGAYKSYCLGGADGLLVSDSLSSTATSTDTSFVLNDASRFPAPVKLWIYPTQEYAYCSGKTGNTLTGCMRGQYGSTASEHSAETAMRVMHEIAHDVDPTNGGPQNFPYAVVLAFYDVDQIAEIADGTRETWDIQPYAYLDLDKYYWSSSARIGTKQDYSMAGGLAYDSVNNKLYVGELSYAHGSVSAFHVFDLSNIGTSLDTTAPTAPGTAVAATDGTVSWSASNDPNAIYVVQKYYEDICSIPEADEYRPIGVSLATTWVDPLYSAGDKYTVVAYDRGMNASQSSTPPGETIPPTTSKHPWGGFGLGAGKTINWTAQ